MHNGRIVCADFPANIWATPTNPFAASFLGRKTWLSISQIVTDSNNKRLAVTSAGNVPVPDEYVQIDLPAAIMIRPEFLLTGANGQLCGRLVQAEFAGSGWWLEAVPEKHEVNDVITAWWPEAQPPVFWGIDLL